MPENIMHRDRTVTKWIEEISRVIVQEKDAQLDIEQKTAANDLVTNMDKWVEKELVKRIRTAYPKDRIVGEEGFGDSIKDMSGTVWFVDPIDGTLNFVLQNENFALMLAIFEDGVPVQSYIYDITLNKLYSAIKGEGVSCNGQQMSKPKDVSLCDGMLATNSSIMIEDKYDKVRKIARKSLGLRLVGSAGLETVEVAKGSIAAYIATNLKPWDVAPGILFMEELGLKATQFNNEPLDLLKNNNIVFAAPKAHEEIMRLIN
ncbi:myo-inositol-1(or 4)-monophosphatase [Alkalibacterium subtropicum]|uniref:Myo-inositol-1(Or 4)-monophosphatase n=1 Tax=Alkalibacterium subtropicum TaxID=753702 RepID=A0A1I1EM27_9LACT|nr:inositol monophosphatase family protein [Alkalibacterium subtropicum]SFB86558.1 myo-inositol-1(or 4)-monophosphatase [Alkalibacterium subtropicum]